MAIGLALFLLHGSVDSVVIGRWLIGLLGRFIQLVICTPRTTLSRHIRKVYILMFHKKVLVILDREVFFTKSNAVGEFDSWTRG